MGNYLYASGRVSARESGLLSLEALRKAASSPSFALALSALGYGDGQESIEGLTEHELSRVRSFLLEIAPDKNEARSFFLTTAARSLKVLYKTRRASRTMDRARERLLARDIISPDWDEAIFKGEVEGLGPHERELYLSLEQALADPCGAREADARIDGVLFNWAKGETKSGSIKTWLTHKIDLVNLSTLLRSRDLGWDRREAGTMLLSGGTVTVTQLLSRAEDREIARMFQGTSASTVAELFIAYPDAADFEREASRLSLSEGISLRIESASAGPMLCYYLEKTAEAENIRLLAIDPATERKNLMEY